MRAQPTRETRSRARSPRTANSPSPTRGMDSARATRLNRSDMSPMWLRSFAFLSACSLVAAAGAAFAASDDIPNLASKDFGWQSNLEDWQDPPPGAAHGPIREDPAYHFNSNAQAGRTGTQPNNR